MRTLALAGLEPMNIDRSRTIDSRSEDEPNDQMGLINYKPGEILSMFIPGEILSMFMNSVSLLGSYIVSATF